MRVADALDSMEIRVIQATQHFHDHESLNTLAFDLELIQKDLEHLQTMIKIKQREDAERH